MIRAAQLVTVLVLLALPAGSWARPSHGAIQALDAGADLDGREYDPAPVP